MRYRLKISQTHLIELESLVLADLPKESAAFALVGAAGRGNDFDMIVRRPIAIPREHYTRQDTYRLELSTAAVNGLIALCEKNGLGAVLCHSHPEYMPYSPSDDFGEKRVFEIVRHFVSHDRPMVSLLFYPGGICGRVWRYGSATPVPITEIVVIGRHIRRIWPESSLAIEGDAGVDCEIFDRQIRAFGREGQEIISKTKVAIVGIGGTGSPVGEQLVRLGIKDLILVDPDSYEPSNRTRVYGTFTSYLYSSWWPFWRTPPRKVHIVAKHLRRIHPDTRITPVARNIVLQEAAAVLLDRDVIFLCTDDHWGRSIVNQIAYQYFIPVINVGVRIATANSKISAGVGVIDVLRPDLPCLWCSQVLQAGRIAAESIPRRERNLLEAEGYVEGLHTTTPSVVSATTTVAGLAVTMFLQLLTDFMGENGDIARLNWNILDGTVRRGRSRVENSCVCNKVRGYGDLRQLPTVTNLDFLEH